MIQRIRTSRISKIIASYLAIQLILTIVQPFNLYALTSGPSQPEFNSFTPIGTSDMVNLSSGDFNYNIPIMDVGGYPINLAYDSGIAMDQEASWVGLGWNLNVGQINRQVRGLPDDFNGDMMQYENNLRPNTSVGVNGDIRLPIFGYDFLNLSVGLGVELNNYNGISFNTSIGPSFDLGERVSGKLQLNGTSSEGASVSPSISLYEADEADKETYLGSLSGNVGLSYNSRQGLSSFNISMANSQSLFKNKTQADKLSYGIKLNDYLTFTPRNELSFRNTNITLSLGVAATELWGWEGPQGQLTAWLSTQSLDPDEKDKSMPAYGYDFIENNINGASILDFNREKDRIHNENIKALPSVNYTYDNYVVSGQGLQGTFRPFRSQVGNVHDPLSKSEGFGGSLGVEFSLIGYFFHGGADIEGNPSSNFSGRWEDNTNPALTPLEYNSNETSQSPNYEPLYFKMSDDINADSEYSEVSHNYNGFDPIKIGIGGAKFKRKTLTNYKVKKYNPNGSIYYDTKSISKIKRENRENRSNAIQKIPNEMAQNYGLVSYRSGIPGHHSAGILVAKPDGSRYVFGETVYNTEKKEVTFNVNGQDADCSTGLVGYSGSDNTIGNNKGRDHFFNRVSTPSYAHSYLLSSVLSNDYEDLTNDGPTFDDLGGYTKIKYSQPDNYNWRIPIQDASYNAGLNTDDLDQKGNYIYGEKELKYVQTIETKTHIAIFELSDREDAKGVSGENGGVNGSMRMKKLDKITLYSLPEYTNDPENAIPIKIAHFIYDKDGDNNDDYDLCPNIPNGTSGEGKLTLHKVYFTYGNSHMGEYTPYVFNYTNNNPDYNLKGYDIWGYYKENIVSNCNVSSGPLSNAEFPFVQQDKSIADQNMTAWSLESIELPSGGKIKIEMESDDYQFVQNRRTMQMFTVVGIGNSSSPTVQAELENDKLFEDNNFRKYIYVKLPNNLPEGYSFNDFKEDYLKDNQGSLGDIGYSMNNLMYFRFLVNMTKSISANEFDYVTGYVKLDNGATAQIFTFNNENYVSLPLQFQDKEGGIINATQQVNPISKAGWYFARKHLNRQSYGLPATNEISNIGDVAEPLLSALGSVIEIFGGPNQALKARNIASTFVPHKSWIRLYEPTGFKYGGGVRVKSIVLDDKWDAMVGNPENELYNEQYGQEYSYLDENGKSSGVSTFEPNGSKENPFVLPIYDDPIKLIAPKEFNYVEKPLGESFFPAAEVTYSRVVVKNLNKNTTTTPLQTISKHATGDVITEFYTSRDFPTISDQTDPDVKMDKTGFLGNFLKVRTRDHLTMSQGFVVKTNNMNGKMKSQRVRAEGQGDGEYLSGVDYFYSVNESNQLDNKLDVMLPDGSINKELLGVNFEMINDFRLSKSESTVIGVDGNLAVIAIFIPLPPFVIPWFQPTLYPNFRNHQTKLKTASTTKVIHSHGILKETVAFDLGSTISTKNLVWDAETGDVLLTEVDNEYNDKYYNFNYPARWNYDKLGLSSKNMFFKGILHFDNSQDDFSVLNPITENTISNIGEFLKLGDQLKIEGNPDLYHVVSIIGNKIQIADHKGKFLSDNASSNYEAPFTIIRSANLNLPNTSMASITTRQLPLEVDGQGNFQSLSNNGNWLSKQILNANTVEYSHKWEPDKGDVDFVYTLEDIHNETIQYDTNGNMLSTAKYNPYLMNVRGQYRANKSFAYLTGRNNGSQGYHPRNEGFFSNYSPFYEKDGSGGWQINNTGWVNASEVIQVCPAGYELENKDALNRFSAAQYDLTTLLPKAVASNSEYREMGFEGFELYTPGSHFDFKTTADLTGNVFINNEVAHTGHSSVQINSTASLLGVNFGNGDTTTNPSLYLGLEQSGSYVEKEYVISCWVKKKDALDALSYESAYTRIHFYNGSSTILETQKFYPEGPIIEGWQKIVGKFKSPNTPYTYFSIVLAFDDYQTGSPIYYFDDIRIQPFNSNLKSFVYDSNTLRLMAELDENNYATFYEYDKEGGLIRVKKETERGIYTIQETRSKSAINQ